MLCSSLVIPSLAAIVAPVRRHVCDVIRAGSSRAVAKISLYKLLTDVRVASFVIQPFSFLAGSKGHPSSSGIPSSNLTFLYSSNQLGPVHDITGPTSANSSRSVAYDVFTLSTMAKILFSPKLDSDLYRQSEFLVLVIILMRALPAPMRLIAGMSFEHTMISSFGRRSSGAARALRIGPSPLILIAA